MVDAMSSNLGSMLKFGSVELATDGDEEGPAHVTARFSPHAYRGAVRRAAVCFDESLLAMTAQALLDQVYRDALDRGWVE